jgi:peptidoglycan biosynthesis protein MviN/MurJ (putative lipid II flippase)
MSNVRKLFSVNAIVFVSLVIGFMNNIAIGGVFGLSRAVDAYFAAAILGSMFMYLIVDYLGKNFLPTYSACYHESPEDAGRVASAIVTLLALIALATVVILLIFAESIFGFLLPGFSDADVHVTTQMFAIQSPSIILMTVNNFHQYIWQHDERYSRVAFARLFLPFMLLVFSSEPGCAKDPDEFGASYRDRPDRSSSGPYPAVLRVATGRGSNCRHEHSLQTLPADLRFLADGRADDRVLTILPAGRKR